MRLLAFVLNALLEEACRIDNGSSFHSFGPEYVKVFLKSSVFAIAICNFCTLQHFGESKDFYQTSIVFFLNIHVPHSLEILK